MRRRRTAEEVAGSLREAGHDLARGLTISDICRKQGIAEATDYRWRQQHDTILRRSMLIAGAANWNAKSIA
jgi:transposase-like protein